MTKCLKESGTKEEGGNVQEHLQESAETREEDNAPVSILARGWELSPQLSVMWPSFLPALCDLDKEL